MGLADWEEIGFVGVDGGEVGFGDASVVPLTVERPRLFLEVKPSEPSPGVDDWQPFGIPFIGIGTGADNEYPIEAQYDDLGRIAAMRVEFVTDVAELSGAWEPVGTIAIKSGRCLVADPSCLHSGLGYYAMEFDLPAGDHIVEVYFWERDMLGIRIRIVETALLTPPRTAQTQN